MTLWLRWGFAAWLALTHAVAAASSWGLCAAPLERSAAQQERFLLWAEAIRADLDAVGAHAALVARAGTDLTRFGVRYTHAALAWRDPDHGGWTLRQLYYDCDRQTPQLFDQGLAAFLLGGDDPAQGYFFALPLAPAAAEGLVQRLVATEWAKALLAPRYRAAAVLGDATSQNCNQWVAELLASVWSGASVPDRSAIAGWMAGQGWAPAPVQLPGPWVEWLTAGSSLLSLEAQDPRDLAAQRVRVTLPEDLARWWRLHWPEAQRLEWCLGSQGLHRTVGWEIAWPSGCAPVSAVPPPPPVWPVPSPG